MKALGLLVLGCIAMVMVIYGGATGFAVFLGSIALGKLLNRK